MDRRHAVPGAAPARAAGFRRGGMGRVRDWAQAQVLPHHPRGVATARHSTGAMADGRQNITRYLDGGVSGMTIEEQIAQWREYLRRRRAIHASDVDELEDHLRN